MLIFMFVYYKPNPECANVIIQCTNGERMIKLIPSPECTQNCQDLSILLGTHQSCKFYFMQTRDRGTL